MSFQQYEQLVTDLCGVIDLPDSRAVLDRGWVEVEGFEVQIAHYENDVGAMYLNFHFGIVTAGRTLAVYRLLLEANLTVYAQDQAQAGINPDTGGIILIVRVPMTPDITGTWLAETLTHYAEHGRYWGDNILTSTDEAFLGICSGEYLWIKV